MSLTSFILPRALYPPGVMADDLDDDALARKMAPAWIHANHRVGVSNKTALLRRLGLWDDGAQFQGTCHLGME